MSHCVSRISLSIYPTMPNETNRGNMALSVNTFHRIQSVTVLVGQVCRYILQCPMRLTEVMWSCLPIHSIESSESLWSVQSVDISYNVNETNRGNVVLSVNAFHRIECVTVLVGQVCRYIIQCPMRLTEVMWSCLSIHSTESSESLCWSVKSVDTFYNVQWD